MSKPPSPYCIGCCSIIIPQTDGMMPYCQECIQSNEDIAADYHIGLWTNLSFELQKGFLKFDHF